MITSYTAPSTMTDGTLPPNAEQLVLPIFELTIEDGLDTEKIDNERITSVYAAQLIARRVFLDSYYNTETIIISTIPTTLGVNEVFQATSPEHSLPFDLTKNRFVCKNTKTRFSKKGVISTSITGERYDK